MNIEDLLKNGLQRNEVFDIIPERTSRILDIGYGDGALLMRLKYQKNCTDLYGIEINTVPFLTEHLDGNWNCDITSKESGIDNNYLNYFNYVILHDVLEHIYNPWQFLQIIHSYMADNGKCVIVTPNAQFWELPYALLSGVFPYGAHGYWNEDHIRWFTMKSLIETSILSGYKTLDAFLVYPQSLKPFLKPFQMLLERKDARSFELPPLGWNAGHLENGFPLVSPSFMPQGPLEIHFPADAKNIYPYLFAVKLMLVCQKTDPTPPIALAPGSLSQHRIQFEKTHSRKHIDSLLPTSVRTILERR